MALKALSGPHNALKGIRNITSSFHGKQEVAFLAEMAILRLHADAVGLRRASGDYQSTASEP